LTIEKKTIFQLAGLDDDGPDDDIGWGGYHKSAWKKNSIALIACDGGGHGVVLWTVGPHLAMEMEEGGLTQLCDLGLDDAPQGISVWEGRVRYHRSTSWESGHTESEAETEGTFRPPTPAEWLVIAQNQCPWSPADWGRVQDPEAPVEEPRPFLEQAKTCQHVVGWESSPDLDGSVHAAQCGQPAEVLKDRGSFCATHAEEKDPE
jgi:hypothetical protein